MNILLVLRVDSFLQFVWDLPFLLMLLGQYNYNEAVVLNLTQDHQQLSHSNGRQQMSMHHGMQPPQQQQHYQSFMSNSSLEVGLNLSLQKSYASQQHSQQQQHQNDYYNQYDGASGYTFDVSMGNNTNQVQIHYFLCSFPNNRSGLGNVRPAICRNI